MSETVVPFIPPQLRERLAALGPQQLDDAELIALLLGTGVAGRSAESLARQMLREMGGLTRIAQLEVTVLSRQRGLGPARASRLVAAFEIGARAHDRPDLLRPAIAGPEDAVRETRDLTIARREHLVGLYLDVHGRLIARETVAIGSLNVARATPRDLLEPAIRLLATGFVVVHNHPSGLLEPSDDDLRFTQAIGKGAALIGVPMYDHIIVSRDGHLSLRARGVAWEGR